MAGKENLKPFTGANDPRRMNGKPKGTIHVSTWIDRMLNDDDFKGLVREGLEIKEYKGAPMKAIIGAQIRLAMAGDTKAFDALLKHGYGTKHIVESGNPTALILAKFEIHEEGDAPRQTETA